MSFKQYLAEARKLDEGVETVTINKTLFGMHNKTNDGKYEKWDADEIDLSGDYDVAEDNIILGDDEAIVIKHPKLGFVALTQYDINESEDEYDDDDDDVIKEVVKSDLESGWFNIPDTESKFGIDPTDVTEFLTDFEVDEGETGEGSFFIEFESVKERKAIVKALLNIGFKAKSIEKFIEAEED